MARRPSGDNWSVMASFRTSPEMHRKIKFYSAETGETRTALLNRLLEEFFAKAEEGRSTGMDEGGRPSMG